MSVGTGYILNLDCKVIDIVVYRLFSNFSMHKNNLEFLFKFLSLRLQN